MSEDTGDGMVARSIQDQGQDDGKTMAVFSLTGAFVTVLDPREDVRVALHIDTVRDDRAWGRVEITTGRHRICFPCWLMGWDLASFVTDLLALQESLRGSARLVNWDESLDWCLRAGDDTEGDVAMGIAVRLPYLPYERRDKELLPPPFDQGLVVTFGTVLVDASQLPDLIKRIEAFLAQSGIVVTNPWETDTS